MPQTPPEQYNSMTERLWSLYGKGLFADGLQLKSLPGEDRSTATEVYCPDVRRSGFNNNISINHLDVVSCWKGLSLQQAEEVLTWERIFRKALEEQIVDSVYEIISTLLAIDDDTFTLSHDFNIDLQGLVHTMLESYYGGKPGQRPASTWCLSDEDLPSFAYNFVRTRDCFIDASLCPRVQVDLLFSLPMTSIVGEVIWQPPNVSFPELPTTLPPGASYSIHPEYRSPDYGNATGPRFAVFHDFVKFTVDSQCLPLEWSQAEHSFKAIVPRSDAPTMETTLTAKSTMHFPAGVRFERSSRYNIKLSAKTHAKSLQSDDISYHLLQRMDSMSPEEKLPVPQNTAMSLKGTDEAKSESPTKAGAARSKVQSYAECKKENINRINVIMDKHVENIARAETVSNIRYNGGSTKRKAERQMPISSVFDVTPSKATRLALDDIDDEGSLELTTKRQRVWQSKAVQDRSSDVVDLITEDELMTDDKGAMAEAWTDKYMDAQVGCATKISKPRGSFEQTQASKSRAYTTSTGTSRIMPALRRKGSVKRMLFNHPGRDRKADSPLEVDTQPVDNRNSMLTCLEDLELLGDGACGPDQATIRGNYEEFVQKSRHMKLDSDEAREAEEYESFFLDSPSGASSVSDGLSAMSLGAD
ncbi:uncharacterized protein N0V89_010681 [Didymosphaeria variabile]|uniref:Uncharacterized protein n=1 Tax=Didymosphaeria variabile TaxID=1932322 RepID=A0A9W8XBQ2_9PLEO|nr:uncharacterized protein N0V89_010681 [Didymosphaeria variabile]KAJ4346749.1 hypothetical protein N0V89_010681 [Didymosphaeria variabile]